MKISLFQGILMGVFGVAAVIGLFVFATYRGGGSSESVGPVTIWGTLPADSIEGGISTLVPSDPELKNVTYVKKNVTTLASDLATAIATGKSPDLVLATQEELTRLAKFLTVIPSSTLSPSDFQKTFVGEGSLFAAPGGYYGVPFLLDPLVLFSNRTILSSSGVAKPPATWESLIGLVPSIVNLTPSKQVTRALIDLGAYDNVSSARATLSTLFLQAGVPVSGVTQGGALAASLGAKADQGVPPGRAVVNFFTQFADPSKVSYTWNVSLPQSEDLFIAGDLALHLGFGSRARTFRQANPNLDFQVDEVPEPATASVKSVYGLLYAFMIPNGAKNPNGAFQIAALLTRGGEQTTFSSATGLAPVNLAVLSSPPADPVGAVVYREALYASGWLSPSAETTDRIFSGMINSVITGRLTFEAALGYAEQALTAALQQ